MAYHIDTKNKIIDLRKTGLSINELNKKTGVTKSTLSLWLRDVKLSDKGKERLIKRITSARFNTAEKRKAQTRTLEQRYLEEAKAEIINNPNYEKIICAIMYWCEGNKSVKDGVTFTNSDPTLISKYLELLRKSFDIDERKFHPCIHLHEYHSPDKQLAFWSKITRIKEQQFIRPYLKPNTGKYKREGYQGCISLRYSDNDLARRIMAVAKAYLGA